MNIPVLLLTLALLAGAAWVLRPVSARYQLPYPSLLVLAALLVVQGLLVLDLDSGLRWNNLYPIAYYVLLPMVIYEAAFRLNADNLFHNMGFIFLLAVPLMLIGVLISAVLLYLGVANEAEFPFIAALITAAMLAANDPAVVLRLTEGLKFSPRLTSILKSESLFNSMLALILVSLALSVEAMGSVVGDITFLQGFVHFVKLFTGGILVGLIAGLMGIVLMHYSRLPVVRLLVSAVVVYATFLLCEWFFAVSGIVALLVAGLLLNAYGQRTDEPSCRLLDTQWRYNAIAASIILFLILGISVYLPILQEQWPVIMMGIAVILLTRALIVFGGSWAFGRMTREKALPLRDQVPLFWGGIKGTVSILLVFTLPAELDYSYTIQALVYGVVLFSLLIQAPTLRFILPK